MRRWFTALCALVVLATIPCVLWLRDVLPIRTRPYIEEKYESWSGVLRIWVYEGWQSGAGTLSGWLNRCITSYEKSHNGVYVQAKYVEPEALIQLMTSGVRPPDMILFPPGVLEDVSGLATLPEISVMNGLAATGGGYAAPVAMGGYLWAYDRNAEISSLTLAQNDDMHLYAAALAGLCSNGFSEGEDSTIEIELPGVDLGLPSSTEENATPEPLATPSPGGTEFFLSPENLTTSAAAYADFTSGAAKATLVSQREISRLNSLSDQGRGPDWDVTSTGSVAFTDQILFLGIVKNSDEEALERQALSEAFLQHLLSEECQVLLGSYGAVSTTWAVANGGSTALRTLEQTLKSCTLIVPPAFSTAWRAQCEQISDAFLQGKISAAECVAQLQSYLGYFY